MLFFFEAMPLVYKPALRTTMKKAATKKVISVIRTFRSLDKVYNSIVDPITFCEITWDDMSDIIPCEKVVSNATKSVPYLGDICELYDKLTVDKDIAETFVSICLKLKQFEGLDVKQRSMFVIKAYILVYKLIFIAMACCGVPKTHDYIVCILDYVNFILSNISE